jgi:S1-C subfamily serine protease
MSYLIRFENWLRSGWFKPLLIGLILLNLYVFYTWYQKTSNLDSHSGVNNAVITGLKAERDRIKSIATSECTSKGMQQYMNGEIGPIDSGANQIDGTKPKPVETLKSGLEEATVRILSKKSSGSGFFISPNLVVTNRHVIEGADLKQLFITSKFLGGSPLPAKLITATPDNAIANPDFALLQIEAPAKQIKPLAIGGVPSSLQGVIASGYPGSGIVGDMNGITPSTVYTSGEVSVVQPQANGVSLVVHTAKIDFGSSGGPLINRCGVLVGVNTFLAPPKQGESASITYYALSGGSLRSFLDKSSVSYSKSDSICGSASSN